MKTLKSFNKQQTSDHLYTLLLIMLDTKEVRKPSKLEDNLALHPALCACIEYQLRQVGQLNPMIKGIPLDSIAHRKHTIK